MTEKLTLQNHTGTRLTVDSIVWAFRSELQQGLAQQQQRLSEETLGIIEEGLAPVSRLIGEVENKVAKCRKRGPSRPLQHSGVVRRTGSTRELLAPSSSGDRTSSEQGSRLREKVG